MRAIFGRREIEKSLGHDYLRSVRECKRFAVEADVILADARAQLDSTPVDPCSHEGIRRTLDTPLTRVAPEPEKPFGNLMRASLPETGQEARIAGMDHEDLLER